MLILYFIIKYFAATEFDCEIGFRVDRGEQTCMHVHTHTQARTYAHDLLITPDKKKKGKSRLMVASLSSPTS